MSKFINRIYCDKNNKWQTQSLSLDEWVKFINRANDEVKNEL